MSDKKTNNTLHRLIIRWGNGQYVNYYEVKSDKPQDLANFRDGVLEKLTDGSKFIKIEVKNDGGPVLAVVFNSDLFIDCELNPCENTIKTTEKEGKNA